MRPNLQSHHGPAGLFAACALSSFGCASIIGADFDKPFQPDGMGGASGSAVTVTATSTVTGSGGAGGTGGTGGSGPVASCPDQLEESTGFCTVHVYVRKANPTTTPIDYTTDDAVMTFAESPPQGYEKTPTSTFILPRASASSDSVALYSCVEKDDGTHTLALNSACENDTFLGYLSSSSVSSVPAGYTALLLEWFSTGMGIGVHDNRRALIAQTHKTSFCVTTLYGSCEPSAHYALSK